jgi:hypothetical protein
MGEHGARIPVCLFVRLKQNTGVIGPFKICAYRTLIRSKTRTKETESRGGKHMSSLGNKRGTWILDKPD